ncbi:MAG: EFR1 family ferrodoxin [Eubacteriales bacterium]|nr:EFR1 family ferrodoxin [Eubacteriales bacterium]
MILYFSGTGNSAYAAKRIGSAIQDKTVNLFERLRNQDTSELHSERPWVVVSPTYAWRIPHILQTWLEQAHLTGSRDIYFVMTCGGGIGNAGAHLKKLCARKNMRYLGCFEVVMPENYIAMFSTPTKEQALETIRQADKAIDQAAGMIRDGKAFPALSVSVSGKLSSGIVNPMFYPMFVHAKKFRTTDSCIACGACADVCPMRNIRLMDGKPVWGKDCTHCMACICRCPKEAIEYGKHSQGLPRYTCPKEP